MEFGIIVLGRMGRSLARQAMEKGHRIVAYNRTQDVTKELAREGLDPAGSIEELVSKLGAPRIIFIYLPHGEPTERACQALRPILAASDIVADGGKASCNVVCPQARPQMATLQPGAAPAKRPDPSRQAEVVAVDVSLSRQSLRLHLEEVIKVPSSALDVTEAEVIVAGGRGVGSEECFHLLEQLAHLMGAAVAVSRPAVDAGWAPYERQVGLSGKTVAPRLYIACGISGANHHVVGMKDSRAVVAINQDPHAPIFQIADVKIVGDLHQVLPSLVERLRRLRQEQGTAEDEEVLRTLANVPGARRVS